MFGLLVLLFNSYRLPLIILFSVPCALIRHPVWLPGHRHAAVLSAMVGNRVPARHCCECFDRQGGNHARIH